MLDTKLVNYNRSTIEICDVIYRDSNGKFVLFHNKYKYGSSALSHLFSQGYVSAELLIDEDFRSKADEKITNKDLKFNVGSEFNRNNYIIVYGIISKRNRNGSFTIPLFSKINLDMFYKNLRLLNYNVEVVFFEAVNN